jgi:hypothetical protein
MAPLYEEKLSKLQIENLKKMLSKSQLSQLIFQQQMLRKQPPSKSQIQKTLKRISNKAHKK